MRTRDYRHSDSPDEHGEVTLPTKAQISLFMAELGRKGGKKGGKRRMETMTSRERRSAARKAALTRWKKERETESPTRREM